MSSGGSSGETPLPLFLVKKEESTEGRKAGRQTKKNHPYPGIRNVPALCGRLNFVLVTISGST